MEPLFSNYTKATKHMLRETYWPVRFYNKARKRRFIVRSIILAYLLCGIITLAITDFDGVFPVFDGRFTGYDVGYLILCFVFTVCAVDLCVRSRLSAKRGMKSFGSPPPCFDLKFYDEYFSIFFSTSNREEKVRYDDILAVKNTKNYIIVFFLGPKYTILNKAGFQGADSHKVLQYLSEKRLGL